MQDGSGLRGDERAAFSDYIAIIMGQNVRKYGSKSDF